jgi:hypothetical protein
MSRPGSMANSLMQPGWSIHLELMPLELDVRYETLRDEPRHAFTVFGPALVTVNTNVADVPDSERLTFAISSFSESPIRSN